MPKANRTVQTPGEAPPENAPDANTGAEGATDAGPSEDGGAGALDDDLADFEGDDLPQGAVATPQMMTPELAAMVQQMVAEGVARGLAAAKVGKPAPNTAQKLPTWQQAAAEAEAMVAKGIRPRAVLTPDGFYCHPEIARSKAAKVGD